MKQEVVINEKDSPHSETVLKFVFKILKNMRKNSQIFHYLLFKSLESVKKTRYIPADFRVSLRWLRWERRTQCDFRQKRKISWTYTF